MIFSHGLHDQVLDGTKTQTRRPVKGDEPCRYVVGKTYAVQPGRAKPGLGRIRVLDVSRVPVVPISPEDALAEGFSNGAGFALRWQDFYGTLDGECWRIEFEVAA